MAVTIDQMAKSYINTVQQEIEKAEQVMQQNAEYLENLKAHLQECNATVSSPSTPIQTEAKELGDGVTQETISLPNPFDALKG